MSTHPPKAGRQAVALTVAAAAMPTLLSAQGMILVGADVLALPVLVAVALAVFLELALVSSALLARAAVLAGRSGRTDLVSTWVFSTASGIFSAAHELVGPADAAGVRSWQLDAASTLAAAVRIAAPLVAAWLWHRILTGDRHDTEATPTRREARRQRLMLAVAVAALDVSRRQSDAPGAPATARARRRLDRRHRTLLRHVPATDEALSAQVSRWLSVVGRVDLLPAQLDTTRDRRQAPEAPALPVASGPVAVEATAAPAPVVVEATRDTGEGDTEGDGGAVVSDLHGDTRARAVALLSQARDAGRELSGADMARALGLHIRSGQRWLQRATDELEGRTA